jgi:hypothetical protein
MALAMGVPLDGKRAGGSKRAWRAGVPPPPHLVTTPAGRLADGSMSVRCVALLHLCVC